MDTRHGEPVQPEMEQKAEDALSRQLAVARSRRGLFQIAAAATPVIVAMSARPAWASNSVLSPSAYCSIHPGLNTGATLTKSHTPSSSTAGCGHSAAVWKTCYGAATTYHHGTGNFTCPENSNFRTLVGKGSYGSNCSFGQLLCDSSYQPSSPYDVDFCAAYLSALNSGSGQVCSGYPCSTTDIANMYCGTYKDCGVTWTRAQCHSYLQSLSNDTGCAGTPRVSGYSSNC